MVRRFSRKAPNEFALNRRHPVLATDGSIVGDIDISIARYIDQGWGLVPEQRIGSDVDKTHVRNAGGVVTQIELVTGHVEAIDREMLPARIHCVEAGSATRINAGSRSALSVEAF